MADEKFSNFLTDIIDADLAEGKVDVVHTRFPPEPNGYLHIGSAKAIFINYTIAKHYGGLFNLRFDDTNPAREGDEYVQSILQDLKWLGAEPNGGIFYGSDYFERCYEYAEQLIKEGKAYVDDLTREEMQEYRGNDAGKPSRPSPYRDRTPEENLDLFRRMRAGEFADGEKTLRAKIDLASPNMNMRDPTIYRIKHVEHHRQSADTGYTYTALPAAPAALPEFGRVDTSWFADAAFLGDSLTAGFCVNEYNIDVGGALVCGYEGISPNTVVNRATVTSPDRGEEVPLDVLAAAQPAKLYILIGTNALVQPGNDDSFLAYYGKMLDDLRTALPNTVFYVQSVLPATQEKVADSLPGLAPDRLAVINAAIQQLCAERGCYYLDLSAEFADDAGYLSTEFSQPDGVHLTVSGYSRWVSYLCTHVPYSKDNPYQAGSTYYLSEDMKGLLSDLP